MKSTLNNFYLNGVIPSTCIVIEVRAGLKNIDDECIIIYSVMYKNPHPHCCSWYALHIIETILSRLHTTFFYLSWPTWSLFFSIVRVSTFWACIYQFDEVRRIWSLFFSSSCPRSLLTPQVVQNTVSLNLVKILEF